MSQVFFNIGMAWREERVLNITYYPLAVFRVRPVTRCTSSLSGHIEAWDSEKKHGQVYGQHLTTIFKDHEKYVYIYIILYIYTRKPLKTGCRWYHICIEYAMPMLNLLCQQTVTAARPCCVWPSRRIRPNWPVAVEIPQ